MQVRHLGLRGVLLHETGSRRRNIRKRHVNYPCFSLEYIKWVHPHILTTLCRRKKADTHHQSERLSSATSLNFTCWLVHWLVDFRITWRLYTSSKMDGGFQTGDLVIILCVHIGKNGVFPLRNSALVTMSRQV